MYNFNETQKQDITRLFIDRTKKIYILWNIEIDLDDIREHYYTFFWEFSEFLEIFLLEPSGATSNAVLTYTIRRLRGTPFSDNTVTLETGLPSSKYSIISGSSVEGTSLRILWLIELFSWR